MHHPACVCPALHCVASQCNVSKLDFTFPFTDRTTGNGILSRRAFDAQGIPSMHVLIPQQEVSFNIPLTVFLLLLYITPLLIIHITILLHLLLILITCRLKEREPMWTRYMSVNGNEEVWLARSIMIFFLPSPISPRSFLVNSPLLTLLPSSR